jgi:uncharacterized spore protein YtfJ
MTRDPLIERTTGSLPGGGGLLLLVVIGGGEGAIAAAAAAGGGGRGGGAEVSPTLATLVMRSRVVCNEARAVRSTAYS